MYSRAPDILGNFKIDCQEMMFVQYMPIAMPGSSIRIPANLECFRPLVDAVLNTLGDANDYVYLTAKNILVVDGTMPNRPGWHIDGFGTDDKNFVWSDSMPTEFCVQEFNLSDDHNKSMVEMWEQARPENIISFEPGSLIGMDNTIVHRVAPKIITGMRAFCKISVSKHQYNLKGNAHNYLFGYKWEMVDRSIERNHPIGKMP